jgi:hypothetical protein
LKPLVSSPAAREQHGLVRASSSECETVVVARDGGKGPVIVEAEGDAGDSGR